MTHPLEHLSESAARRAFWLLLCATLATMATLGALDAGLRTAASPRGIVSFELARDLPSAEAMLRDWGEAGRLRAAMSLGLDALFLLLYPNAIALACLRVSRRLPKGRLRGVAVWLSWGQYAAGLLDGVENVALARLLLGARDAGWPALAFWCAVPKFALVAAGIGYVVAAALAAALVSRRA